MQIITKLTNLTKIFVLCFSALALSFCSKDNTKIDKRIENGIEVIQNHIEPYEINGEPYTFALEKELTISQERKDLVDRGMMSMGEFTVDSNGNIYIVGWENKKDLIYKLDSEGNFITSFGQKGQGPGELEMPTWPGISGNKFYISDRGKKIVLFDEDGHLYKENRFKTRVTNGDILKNGNYLFWGGWSGYKTNAYSQYNLSLFSPEFKKIRDLDVYKLHYRNERLAPYFMWRVRNDRIYIINEERGYEFLIYDLDGNLIRKIQKDYKPVSPSLEIKKAILGPQYQETGKRNEYVPNPLPPIKLFMVDDQGRLFVMTYEKGSTRGEFIYDIFNSEGVFIGRKSLNLRWADLSFGVKYQTVSKNKLYCYRYNEDGFMEMNIYKIKWIYKNDVNQ
ncbi:MAG: 6-bladed beta-propeller [Candidatus Lokiarchaeota archaeon]|nr:6-bladed beta-propeller [Candidatus Lokiarchaeota archaeon]